MSLGKITLLLISILLFSCNSKDGKQNFYSYTKDFDLWRFPLVEPYEITSPTNSDDWFLVIKQPKIEGTDYFAPDSSEFQLTNIDSVGIRDSVLLVKSSRYYWPKLGGDFETVLLIDTKVSKEFIFSVPYHAKPQAAKMQELQLANMHLYHFSTIKSVFQEKLVLPNEWPK